MKTLAEALEQFLGRYGNKESQRSYKQTLDPLIDFLGSERDISLVTLADLDFYINRHVKNKITRRGKKQSLDTERKHIKNIKAFFNYFVEYTDDLEKSPAQKIKQSKPPKNRPSKAMPEEKYQQLIRYCIEQDLVFETAQAAFWGDSAARLGGADALLVENIDWEKRTAWVTEKADSDGEVYFGEFCELALKRWLATRIYDSPYVFSNDRFKGAQYTPAALAQRFRRVCMAAGIGSWGPHSLRHRFNQTMRAAGVERPLRARILRHSERVNDVYGDEQSLLKQIAEQFHIQLADVKAPKPPSKGDRKASDNILYLEDFRIS